MNAIAAQGELKKLIEKFLRLGTDGGFRMIDGARVGGKAGLPEGVSDAQAIRVQDIEDAFRRARQVGENLVHIQVRPLGKQRDVQRLYAKFTGNAHRLLPLEFRKCIITGGESQSGESSLSAYWILTAHLTPIGRWGVS